VLFAMMFEFKMEVVVCILYFDSVGVCVRACASRRLHRGFCIEHRLWTACASKSEFGEIT
jgi:hypothetical protein